MKRTGYFSCENPLVQKGSMKPGLGTEIQYVEVPTDCPQQDERMGYTGDGQVFALTGAYNFNTDAFWKNFLRILSFGAATTPRICVRHGAADRTCRDRIYQHAGLGQCGHDSAGDDVPSVRGRGGTAAPV